MCYGNGTAFGYLFFKQRNNRTVGTENVAESDGDEFCVKAVFAYRLNYHFTDTLCRAHYVCGVDRLVC